MRHLHLDPVGGAAGDMFVAALLHAFPEHRAATVEAAAALSGAACDAAPHRDRVMTGMRFTVREAGGHHHHHVAWRDIRARIEASALPAAARAHALGIFGLLAEAEAEVHGVPPDQVEFHEVGAADSVADIVGAATLAALVEPARWSTAPLPLGGGRVRTAHGLMPVPAPATAILLRGLPVIDDGVEGERVTPTGAAILRHLCREPAPPGPRMLTRTGTGFGTRELPGMSNFLRVLAFEAEQRPATPAHRELAVIAFEVDDQSAEDLAAGLDRLRGLEAVHDVLQMPALGKKGRMASHVQVLARPDAVEAVVEACFRETTTIGLRVGAVQGRVLPRRTAQVQVDGHMLRVKLADRPGGATGKAEAADLLAVPGHAARDRLRREAERAAAALPPE